MKEAHTRRLVAAAFLFFGILWAPGFGLAADQWRFATLAPKDVGWSAGINSIVIPAITEATGGELTTKVYWGGIMGDDEDVLRKMRCGLLDGAGLSGQGVIQAAPEMAVMALPFMFQNYEEVDFIKERMGPVMEKLVQDCGFFLLAWVDQDFDQVYSTHLPMDRLEHFQQSKIQHWCGALEEELFKALGAQAVPLDVPQAASAYHSGKIDASIAPALWMVGAQLYSVVRYINPVNIRYSPALIITTSGAWNDLPAPYKDEFWKRRKGTVDEFCAGVREGNAKAQEAMFRYGVNKVEMDPGSLRLLQGKTRVVWDRLAGRLYSRGLLNELTGHLEEFRNSRP